MTANQLESNALCLCCCCSGCGHCCEEENIVIEDGNFDAVNVDQNYKLTKKLRVDSWNWRLYRNVLLLLVFSVLLTPVIGHGSHGHGHSHGSHHNAESSPQKSAVGTALWTSLLAVFVISLASLLVIILYPFLSNKTSATTTSNVFTFLIAMSIGSLVGDALLHQLPEAFENVENPKRIGLGIAACVGISCFFIFEKFLSRFHHGHGHGHSHRHGHHTHHGHADMEAALNTNDNKKAIRPVGWLILLGDAFHNVMDGLIIGAAFSTSSAMGLSTSIAILFHEIPHELGDYAVVLAAGFSPLRGFLLNLLSNITAFVGAIIGVLLSTYGGSMMINRYLNAFTGGTFLYIALADLVPELLHDHSTDVDADAATKSSIFENVQPKVDT